MSVPITSVNASPAAISSSYPWPPYKEDAWYYAIPSPESKQAPLYFTIIQPLLNKFGALKPRDPTFGRFDLPYAPREEKIREGSGNVVEGFKVPLGDKGDWVWYQVYENPKAVERAGHYGTLFHCHGINDYGGKFSEQSAPYLEAGYRVVVPDLPAHGRSTGLHAYLPSLEVVLDGVRVVMMDLSEKDKATGRKLGKVVIAGGSMGAWTAAAYLCKYQNPPSNLPISGLLIMAPMLEISPHSRPPYIIELIARGIASWGGRLEMAEAHRGKGSNDKGVDDEFLGDPQTYHSKLRVATGLAILKAIDTYLPLYSRIKVPLLLIHGTADRITSHEGSKVIFEKFGSQDKRIELVEGGEHILVKGECIDPVSVKVRGLMWDFVEKCCK